MVHLLPISVRLDLMSVDMFVVSRDQTVMKSESQLKGGQFNKREWKRCYHIFTIEIILSHLLEIIDKSLKGTASL